MGAIGIRARGYGHADQGVRRVHGNRLRRGFMSCCPLRCWQSSPAKKNAQRCYGKQAIHMTGKRVERMFHGKGVNRKG